MSKESYLFQKVKMPVKHSATVPLPEGAKKAYQFGKGTQQAKMPEMGKMPAQSHCEKSKLQRT